MPGFDFERSMRSDKGAARVVALCEGIERITVVQEGVAPSDVGQTVRREDGVDRDGNSEPSYQADVFECSDHG